MKTIARVSLAAALLCGLSLAQVPSQFPRTVTATIAAAGSLSAPVNLQGCTIARMELSTFASSAVLTFQTSSNGGTFLEMVDFYATPIQYPASTGNVAVVMIPQDWYRMRWMRVRSGTAASPVTQSGGVTITFTCQD